MFDLLDDYCGHGNVPEYCDEICPECGHECFMHEDGQCSGAVNGYSGGGHRVSGECDCEEFKD